MCIMQCLYQVTRVFSKCLFFIVIVASSYVDEFQELAIDRNGFSILWFFGSSYKQCLLKWGISDVLCLSTKKSLCFLGSDIFSTSKSPVGFFCSSSYSPFFTTSSIVLLQWVLTKITVALSSCAYRILCCLSLGYPWSHLLLLWYLLMVLCWPLMLLVLPLQVVLCLLTLWLLWCRVLICATPSLRSFVK